jgi:multidrug efflux system membrane fusion protein
MAMSNNSVARGRCALSAAILLFLLAATPGCQRGSSKVTAPEPPAVPVAHPVQRDVTDFVDFTGRTDAVQSVNIVARVTGFLVQMPFREGSLVKAGDLLFEIDPRPYQAQLDQAQSQVTLAQAQLDLAESTLGRYKALKKDTPGAVSDQAIDQYQAAVAEARARVFANKKSMEVYQLNKEFTRVVSPIDGQVGRYYLTTGNLVNQDQTLLTTVVSLDPMYAYFEVDERTMLRVRKAINEGKVKPYGGIHASPEQSLKQFLAAQALFTPGAAASMAPGVTAAYGLSALELTVVPVSMALQGEDRYEHQGMINFANNAVNPATGSMTVRGVFANPLPKNGVRLLTPGMYVRIRLPIGKPQPALLVIDRAIQSDQGQRYVYVIDSEGKAQQRPITIGALQEDGLRVITKGLEKSDRVIVGTLQQIQPRMKVRTEERDMPSFGPKIGNADKSK